MGTISVYGINYFAVAVAAIATFLLGGMWYAPLFGRAWIKAHGFTEEQVKQLQAQRSPAVFFGGMVACYLVLALVLAILYRAGGIQSVLAGAGWGLFIWVGLAALKMTDHIASGKPLAAYGIDASFQLIALLVIGGIVGGWN